MSSTAAGQGNQARRGLLIGDRAQMGHVGCIPAQAKQRPVVVISHVRGREGDLQPLRTLYFNVLNPSVKLFPLSVTCSHCQLMLTKLFLAYFERIVSFSIQTRLTAG